MNCTRKTGVAVIGAGICTGVVLWGVFRLAGVDLDLNDSASRSSVGLVDVIVATTVAGFAAWAAYTVMLRRGWARYWPWVGSAVLSISLIGPDRLAEGDAVAPLSVMHLAVGFVLMAGFGCFLRSPDERARAWAHLPFRRGEYSGDRDAG